jgi:hypothetical protein
MLYHFCHVYHCHVIRWSPPEVGMTEGSVRRINSSEDLWCYGFFLYELFTKGMRGDDLTGVLFRGCDRNVGPLARIPYGKTTWTDAQEYLDTMVEMQEGGLLPQPDTCPDDMYAIMSDCWAQDPKARPAVAVSLAWKLEHWVG